MTDVEVHVEAKIFQAHKLILTCHSPYFHKLLISTKPEMLKQRALRQELSSLLSEAVASPESLLSIIVYFASHLGTPEFEEDEPNAPRSRRRCVPKMRPSTTEFPEAMSAPHLLVLLVGSVLVP
ncbi:hypothetical protein HPB51_005635 [Rhipicephalus microplus]|uniref:BTB domain-containing protein n=1 Tax=Rhipicephalus microplus TaxID=6941 RepID=A0A9J6EMI5_RHIMP|nr:hypothetical protein HPB51_005635 [Rhipicephalus microplus]